MSDPQDPQPSTDGTVEDDVDIDDIDDIDDGPTADDVFSVGCPNLWCGSLPGERCVNMAQMRAGMIAPRQVAAHPARRRALAASRNDSNDGR